MVQLLDLEALRAEQAALEAENAALRSKVVSAQLAGDETALMAEETPRSTARLAILTREQQVLVAGLRLGEELVALRKSNEVLFRRGQQLQGENAALRIEAAKAPAKTQQQATATSAMASPKIQLQQSTTSATAPQDSTVPRKCSPEEKEERKELVASLLRAGLSQDVQTISMMRTNAVPPPVVPKIQLNPDGYDSNGRSRSTEVVGSRTRETGARNRESSHSGAVEESKYMRELAIRDMLRGISRNTPRYSGR